MLDLFGDEVRSKHYAAIQISESQATDIVKRFHYSGKVVSNSKIHIGIFDKSNKLVGALSFGPAMNGEKTTKKLGNGLIYELNRMVMDDDQPRNAESQAISISIKYLKKFTDVAAILSFSDGKENNVGYIYQATNWKYVGYMISDSFYSLDGDITHAVTVWHRYKEKHHMRETHTTHEILRHEFSDVYKIKCKQHVYLMEIKKGALKNFESKPYPKLETEKPIMEKHWICKNGKECDEKIVILGKCSNEFKF